MKKVFLLLIPLVLLVIPQMYAQYVWPAESLTPDEDYENILVEKVTSDKHVTTFVIWVKKEVKLHKHEHHTEHVYVLEGEAEMKIGEQAYIVRAGDFIFIPENTPHRVTVINGPMKVISVQAPEFLGNDRVMLEK